MPPHLGIIVGTEQAAVSQACHLVDGLLNASAEVRIALLVPAGGEGPGLEMLQRWGPRVRLHPYRQAAWQQALTRWDRLSRGMAAWRRRGVHAANRAVEGLLWGKEATRWSGRRASAPRVLAAILAVLLFPLAWLGAIGNQLVFGFLLPVLGYPVHGLRRLLTGSRGMPSLEALLDELDCAAWVRLSGADPVPVLEIQRGADTYWIPSAVLLDSPGLQAWDHAGAHGPSGRASARAEARLEGPKPALIRSAHPRPEGPGNRIDRARDAAPASADGLDLGSATGRPFILIPPAVSGKKSGAFFAALQQTVRELDQPLDLVCMGSQPPPQQDIDTVPTRWLGPVAGEERTALFRRAWLAVFPPGPDPDVRIVLEALRQGCPITCPDRRAYRQLLADCPESVLYFDPDDAASIVRAIRRTLNQWDHFRGAQQAAFAHLTARDAVAVARAVLAVVVGAVPEEAAHAA